MSTGASNAGRVREAGCGGVVDDGMLTVAQAVKHSGVCRAELYKTMGSGELAFAKWGKRRLIPRKALNDLLASKLAGGAGGDG